MVIALLGGYLGVLYFRGAYGGVGGGLSAFTFFVLGRIRVNVSGGFCLRNFRGGFVFTQWLILCGRRPARRVGRGGAA